MKTTISNIGKMRKINGNTKSMYAPFSNHVFHADQLHERINYNFDGSYYTMIVSDRYFNEYKSETVSNIKNSLIGGHIKPRFKHELLNSI